MDVQIDIIHSKGKEPTQKNFKIPFFLEEHALVITYIPREAWDFCLAKTYYNPNYFGCEINQNELRIWFLSFMWIGPFVMEDLLDEEDLND